MYPYAPHRLGSYAKSFTVVMMLGLALICPVHAESPGSSVLEDEFRNPPLSVRPRAFWDWLNGNVERERIIYDLDQMKEKGMGGAEIWDVAAISKGDQIPAGPRFLDPESADTIKFALKEGQKRGLRMGMITSSGWNAGGTWVTPDWASKMLVSHSLIIPGGKPFSDKLPFPEVPKECPKNPDGLPVFYKEVALLAVPESADKVITSTASILNLSNHLQADGTLNWTPPEGTWRVFRFVCTNTGQILIVPSPNSAGLFIDFLDPQATKRHFGEILKRLDITVENSSESGLKYLEVDSMELHEGNPWTDRFAAWFEKNYHYDILNHLPVLEGWTIQDKSHTDGVLYDYRRAVSDLLIHSHYETGSAFLNQYGIDLVGEAGGPGPPIWNTCPVDALKALGNVNIPRGEFWIKHRNMFLIKEVASAAHIYGKNVIDAESFTTWRRFVDAPYDLKILVDRAFAEGLNQITIHTFSHSPESSGLPGRTYHAGIDINPNITWWPFARPFMDYLSRCSYMLQQGKPVADVLWYYGDQAPNFFPRHHDVPVKPRLPGLGRGYDFDVVNSDVILNRLTVNDGRYTLPEGVTYRVLAFPPEASVSLKVLEKLAAFVHDGGILVGQPPVQIPGATEQDQKARRLKELSVTLWGDEPSTGVRNVAKGKVYCNISLNKVLEAENVQPDFQITGRKPHIDFIHRTTAEEDIFFVRNESQKAETIQASFRSNRKHLQSWDPSTGKIRALESRPTSKGSISTKLHLDPGGSTFIIVSDRVAREAMDPLEESTVALNTDGPWTLRFPPGLGATTEPLVLSELKSWTALDSPGEQYFSGIAEYTTTFNITGDVARAKALDFGDIRDVAEIEVNGTSLGVLWKPPYRVDVSGHLKQTDNQLKVRVANLWNNRLVGDMKTTESLRITRTNTNPDQFGKELLPSGLLGPVKLVSRQTDDSL